MAERDDIARSEARTGNREGMFSQAGQVQELHYVSAGGKRSSVIFETESPHVASINIICIPEDVTNYTMCILHELHNEDV